MAKCERSCPSKMCETLLPDLQAKLEDLLDLCSQLENALDLCEVSSWDATTQPEVFHTP